MAESSNAPEIFSKHAKAIMTLRNGKTLEQPSQKPTQPRTKTNQKLTVSKPSKDKEDLKARDESHR